MGHHRAGGPRDRRGGHRGAEGPGDRPVPARRAADRPRVLRAGSRLGRGIGGHPRGARRGHRGVGHRRAEDVHDA
ncbi:hypothetical protein B7486_78125, partial [cyanobacterium TDX16]